jgi:hypothetical protein
MLKYIEVKFWWKIGGQRGFVGTMTAPNCLLFKKCIAVLAKCWNSSQ